MKITDAFIAEHAELYAQFDHLEETIPGDARTLSDVKIPGSALAAELAEHAQLEEELLFDALEAALGSDEALMKVRDDHQRIEQLMQDMLNHLENIQRLGHARRILLQAIKVARAHFSREETETFPLAEEILGDAKLIQLGAEWEKRKQ